MLFENNYIDRKRTVIELNALYCLNLNHLNHRHFRTILGYFSYLGSYLDIPKVIRKFFKTNICIVDYTSVSPKKYFA